MYGNVIVIFNRQASVAVGGRHNNNINIVYTYCVCFYWVYRVDRKRARLRGPWVTHVDVWLTRSAPSPSPLVAWFGARPFDCTRLLDGAPPLSIFRTGPNGRATTLLLCRARCFSVPALHPPRSGPRSRQLHHRRLLTRLNRPCSQCTTVRPVAPLVESEIENPLRPLQKVDNGTELKQIYVYYESWPQIMSETVKNYSSFVWNESGSEIHVHMLTFYSRS